jgi:hypothetical protein
VHISAPLVSAVHLFVSEEVDEYKHNFVYVLGFLMYLFKRWMVIGNFVSQIFFM